MALLLSSVSDSALVLLMTGPMRGPIVMCELPNQADQRPGVWSPVPMSSATTALDSVGGDESAISISAVGETA